MADGSPSGKCVVKRQTRAVEPSVGGVVAGDDKRHGRDQPAGNPEKRRPFPQGLMHESEIEIYVIPQAAVNELRIFAAGTRSEVVFFDQRDTQSALAQSQIARDARAVDTPAQNN